MNKVETLYISKMHSVFFHDFLNYGKRVNGKENDVFVPTLFLQKSTFVLYK